MRLLAVTCPDCGTHNSITVATDFGLSDTIHCSKCTKLLGKGRELAGEQTWPPDDRKLPVAERPSP